MGVVVTGGNTRQTGPYSPSVVASGGRTFTFVNGGGVVQCSSGSFLSDGFLPGGLLDVSNTSSNNKLFVIVTVDPSEMALSGNVVTNEGPLSSLATLSGTNPNRFLFGSELQNGRWGSYWQMSQGNSFPSTITATLEGGPGITGRWGPDGISLETKFGKGDSWVGTHVETLTLEVLSPADGTTVIASANRAVTAADADYVAVTISQDDLAELAEAGTLVQGDQLRLRIRVVESGTAGATSANDNFPYVRFGKLTIDQA